MLFAPLYVQHAEHIAALAPPGGNQSVWKGIAYPPVLLWVSRKTMDITPSSWRTVSKSSLLCGVQLQCCMHFWCKCSACVRIYSDTMGEGSGVFHSASAHCTVDSWWHSFRDSEDKTHSSSFFSTDREKVFGAEVAKVSAFCATHATCYVWQVSEGDKFKDKFK